MSLNQKGGGGVPNWYPLKLTYHVRIYAFGERLIPERLGKQGVPDGVVAETWEISDYRTARATITNGELAGQPFHDVTLAHPDEVVGKGWRGPHFPLLGKFLDASHRLPVHLHADDETALRVHNEPNGKTEAWHILWAAPGASILAGIKPGTTQAQLIAAFKSQDYDSVMPRYPIAAGDTVYVPGGILHSFGPDTLIFEIQQTSDLGQNVMPEDLYGRRLSEDEWNANVEATLSELKTDFMPRPNAGLERVANGNRYRVGCASKHFALERWSLSAPLREPAHPDGCFTISNVGDPVQITISGGTETLGHAESCVMPAALGEFELVPEGTGDLIVCYVPNLMRDIVQPLRDAGHSDEVIASLGEVPIN
ncbi:MAG: mannose-6-phosphate isomerase [Thermomicrobiales bacterium]|nr:mannose-6-phosphate isomerase [Thermomicrobiales bacterium]